MTITEVLHLEATESTRVADELSSALATGSSAAVSELASTAPSSRRDRFATLLQIYRLHTAPITDLGTAARFQHHPVVAELKTSYESQWLDELATLQLPEDMDEADAVSGMRALAARDRLPDLYKWVAREASWDEVVIFLALEGGPDAGFDDLVAACQVGLTGSAKLELATNYWDEMGNGDINAVHTTLHDRLVAAIEMPHLPLSGQPTSALERAALGGLLTTNRWLQPEAMGALGLIELQAGPRCRLVLKAFDRCDAPAGAYPFYEVHAEVDPRHGNDWLANAVAPLAAEHPDWNRRMLRGALWRSAVNRAFFDDADRLLRG
jgi:hypothetical protein